MTEQEARVLLTHIKAECGRNVLRGAHVHRLGNGEYVIRTTRPEDVHFWSLQDFIQWQKKPAA